MIYYIIYKNKIDNPISIGESSFKNFWTDIGFKILCNMADNHPNELDNVIVKSEDGKERQIDKFLKEISKLKIIGESK